MVAIQRRDQSETKDQREISDSLWDLKAASVLQGSAARKILLLQKPRHELLAHEHNVCAFIWFD